MNITFLPLTTSHLSLMLTWLETPHVKAWWDTDVVWTAELIHEKFGDYVQGFKWQDGIKKSMHAYIIQVDDTPIGYFQTYNAYDFPRSVPLTNLPPNMAAFDMFIGDPTYLGKNIGSQALRLFIDTMLDTQFIHIFADPDIHNPAARKSYEKAGLRLIYEKPELNETGMLYTKDPLALIEFCKSQRNPHRPALYHICYELLNAKKKKSTGEQIALIQTLLGLGLSEDKASHFEEGIRLSEKTPEVPDHTVFWLHLGLGDCLSHLKSPGALLHFTKAHDIAIEKGLKKSLRELAEHKMHSAT